MSDADRWMDRTAGRIDAVDHDRQASPHGTRVACAGAVPCGDSRVSVLSEVTAS